MTSSPIGPRFVTGSLSLDRGPLRNRPLVTGIILLVLLVAGIWNFRARQALTDRDLRGAIRDEAMAIAATIRAADVAALSFTPADEGRPQFQLLREQIRGYQTISPYRGIYTLALREGQLFFGPESYADDDPQASPVGTVYEQPSPEDFAIFNTGVAVVQGPVADEYGNFVSALASVLNPSTGEVLMVVGVDMEGTVYEAAMMRAGLLALLPVITLGVIVLVGLGLVWWRERLPRAKQPALRYIEVYAIALFGLAATLIASMTISADETRLENQNFQQLAETKAQLVIKAFNNLQDYRLGSIVQFFNGSNLVEREEFHLFVAPLLQGAAIDALEWVPYIPAGQRTALEEQTRAEGIQFSIWQNTSDGMQEPAPSRKDYFPVLYVEPPEGNLGKIGYDLSSDPVRRVALEAARASGQPVITDPLIAIEDLSGKPSLLAIEPVFPEDAGPETQVGFVVAVFQLQPFLQSALFLGPGGDESSVVDFYQLESGQAPRFISSSSAQRINFQALEAGGQQPALDESSATLFPMFIFDKSYALVVSETAQAPELFSGGLLTAVGGVLLTSVVAAFSGYVVRRRDDLASLVLNRTTQLRENEAYLTTLLDTMGDVVFITRMPDRNVEYVNQAVTNIFGYPTEEVIGSTTRKFYAGDGYAEYGQKVREALGTGENHIRAEVELLHKDGHTIWAEMNATVRFHDTRPASLITVVRDISDRIRNKERIETQLNRLAALHNIDVAITSSLDLQTVLGVVLEQTVAHLHMDAACVLLLNPITRKLTYAAGRGFHTKNAENIELNLGESVAGKVALNREMIHIPDPAKDARFDGNVWIKSEGITEYFAAPLIAKGKVSGVLEICNRTPFKPDPEWWGFLKTLAGEAAIAVDSARLLQDLQSANFNIVHAYDATIEGWSQALDLRDRETKGHTQRVTEMTLRLARAMGVSDADLVDIRRGALLHDIGKIGIPDSILMKPGELSTDEWELMHKHPRFAFDMLSPITYLIPALDIPYCHHEKWDGTGYPRGLKGEQIPLAARIFAVADVYDALTSDRPYRRALSKLQALAYIREQSGKHFDPKVAELFLSQFGEAWFPNQ